MANMWMIRSQGGSLLPLFLEKNVVAIGWIRLGDLKNKSKEDIKKSLLNAYPESSKAVHAWAGLIDSFVNKIKKDDYIITYDSSLRNYYIGQIVGDYSYNQKINEELPNTRKIKWLEQTISRDLLSVPTKNSLGSSLTLFKLSKEIENEFMNILSGKAKTKTEDEKHEEVELQAEELFENATENLKEKILNLSPDDMEELIKEILNAMGYIARRTPKGADRGIDVFASKDGLGLEDPRIFAEVKHRKGQMGAPEIRTFIGGRQPGDKCLYVSTGGFTKEARYEAERSKIALSLVDLNDIAELISLHYDKFRAEGKVLLPLRKVYLPA